MRKAKTRQPGVGSERHGEAGRGPVRSKKHLKFIRLLPCALSGYEGATEAAHIRHFSGMAIKPSDAACLPLRAELHRVEHEIPADFWLAACGMTRDQVATFAYGLGALSGDEEAARIYLEDMQRAADRRFIVAALNGYARQYVGEVKRYA